MARLVEQLKIAMLDRLTTTQSSEEDRIMFIRKANQKCKETKVFQKMIKNFNIAHIIGKASKSKKFRIAANFFKITYNCGFDSNL